MVGHHDPSLFIPRANFQPAPRSESIRVNPCLENLSREASHRHHSAPAVLILLHLFVNIISNNAPRFHSNADDIPELLFLRGLAPICLSFASCQNIRVELTAKFIQTIDLGAVCEDPQTIKIFHNDLNTVFWFFRGGLSISLYMQKSTICCEI